MPRIRKTPFPPWETRNADGIEKRYIRMGATIMASGAMMDLSSSAFRVYCYMRLESSGRKDFRFPYSKYRAYMSRPTFLKARDELVEKGFINIVRNNRNLRKANDYAFSERWKAF